MGTKLNPGKFDCYENAAPDEPMFVLLARDEHAPILVREWADLRESEGEDPRKVEEARRCASAMAAYRDTLLRKRRTQAENISLSIGVPVSECEVALKALDDDGARARDMLVLAKRANCDWRDVLDFALRFHRATK